MANVILTHCEPVTVWTSSGGAKAVVVTVDLGGSSAGDGYVEVTGAQGEVPSPPPQVPTGGGNDVPLSDVTEVNLHYVKSAGPSEITATVSVAE